MFDTVRVDETVAVDVKGAGEPVLQLGSKYFLAEPLGRGAMGVVHAATTQDDQPLAVKILRPELSTDDRTVARFVQERQIFSRVDHPNVVRVHDLVAEGDQLGIVMERVNGGDLKKRVEDRSLAPSQAMAISAEVAAGLQAIHAVDVVHRDLKPANILLSVGDNGRLQPKISDFGISHRVGRESPLAPPRRCSLLEHGLQKLLHPQRTPLAYNPIRRVWSTGSATTDVGSFGWCS